MKALGASLTPLLVAAFAVFTSEGAATAQPSCPTQTEIWVPGSDLSGRSDGPTVYQDRADGSRRVTINTDRGVLGLVYHTNSMNEIERVIAEQQYQCPGTPVTVSGFSLGAWRAGALSESGRHDDLRYNIVSDVGFGRELSPNAVNICRVGDGVCDGSLTSGDPLRMIQGFAGYMGWTADGVSRHGNYTPDQWEGKNGTIMYNDMPAPRPEIASSTPEAIQYGQNIVTDWANSEVIRIDTQVRDFAGQFGIFW